MDEGKLHRVVVAALNGYGAMRPEVKADVLELAEQAQSSGEAGVSLLELRQRLDALSAEQAALLNNVLEDMDNAELNDRLQSVTEAKQEILSQMGALEQDEEQQSFRESWKREMEAWLHQQPLCFTEYDDILTRRFVEKITVVDAETIRVKIRDTDVEIEQKICLNWNRREGEGSMAVFITGDLHGNFRRFKKEIFYEQAELSKEDCVICCGDFGGVWDGSAEERHWLDWLEAKPFTTLFVSGNHENFDLLAKYPVEEWNGGAVQRIRPSVIHLMRGQVYDIQGKTFFTMGGASSHDIQDGILEADDPLLKKKCRRLDASGAMYRVNRLSWCAAELPSEEEYQTASANLDRVGWAVDYIITHCCPSSVQDIFSGGLYRKDALTEFLNEVSQRCRFKCWFLGHYHEDMVVEKRYVMLYEQIIRLKL